MPKALPMVDISAPICCAPVSAAPLDDATALEIALRLKALADPVRIRLVSILLADGGENTTYRIIAFVLFVVASITDRIDGDLARAKGLVTTFGKVADPIADKALTGAGFITLSMIGEIPWWITVVILARELGITLMRFWVIRHGVMPASRGGKVKTFLQALAIGLFVIPLSSLPVEWLWRGLAWAILLAALAVTGLILVAALAALGTWQVQRRTWKHDLIARVEARVHADPVAAPGPGHLDAVDTHTARGDGHQPREGPGDRRLARSGLAHQAQDLARRNRQ